MLSINEIENPDIVNINYFKIQNSNSIIQISSLSIIHFNVEKYNKQL